ncbi:MlaD family protein [Saltatorellus ferox]|uniref:MlaD family protein n=1 Tax=Saltatorellus ferox TaxID=2528018 RepID=UPI003AF33562
MTLLILALFWLGASRLTEDVDERITYFDESVQGLEVGAPIKIRGVTIGKVTEIVLAPDRRLVEVHFQARVAELRKIGALGAHEDKDGEVSPEMRIVVASQGITGVKFLEADFFPPDTPTVELSFKAPGGYIPSAPSTLKSLEDALRGLGDEIPLAIRDFRSMAVTLDERLASLDTHAISHSLVGLSDELRGALQGTSEAGLGFELRGLISDLRTTAHGVDTTLASLSGESGALTSASISVDALATDLRASLAKADQLLDGIDLAGMLDSIRGAADSTRRVTDGLAPASQSMPEVLRDLRAMMRKIEALASLLERDPGVLLRGRG